MKNNEDISKQIKTIFSRISFIHLFSSEMFLNLAKAQHFFGNVKFLLLRQDAMEPHCCIRLAMRVGSVSDL